MACHHPTTQTRTAVAIDILVVDDSATDAEITLLALDRLHPRPRVLWLADGGEAMAYLMCRQAHPRSTNTLPSLVLTDIHMPSLSGLELLALIRSEPGLKAVPVIVLSGLATVREVLECYQLGATGYVEKCFSYETFTAELIQVVSKCMRTSAIDKPLQKGAP